MRRCLKYPRINLGIVRVTKRLQVIRENYLADTSITLTTCHSHRPTLLQRRTPKLTPSLSNRKKTTRHNQLIQRQRMHTAPHHPSQPHPHHRRSANSSEEQVMTPLKPKVCFSTIERERERKRRLTMVPMAPAPMLSRPGSHSHS